MRKKCIFDDMETVFTTTWCSNDISNKKSQYSCFEDQSDRGKTFIMTSSILKFVGYAKQEAKSKILKTYDFRFRAKLMVLKI